MSPALRTLPGALLAGLLLASATTEARPSKSATADKAKAPPPPPAEGLVEPVPLSPPAEAPAAPAPPSALPLAAPAAWPRHTFSLGLETQRVAEGHSTNFYGSIESERLGLFGRISHFELPASRGSKEKSETRLTNLHLSWALVGLPMLRLRGEAGLSLISSQQLNSFLGASVGLSGEVHLLSLVTLEARAQLTPLPYRQFDLAAGAALFMGPLALRAGQRLLVVDKAALFSPISSHSVLAGPYFSAGLAF